MLWSIAYGPAVVNVLTTETSADDVALPPLPVLSVLLPGTGSDSVPLALAVLSNAAAAVIVAVTVIVVFAPAASVAMVHGSARQPPVTLVMVMFDGVSVTWMFVAGDGPALLMKSV